MLLTTSSGFAQTVNQFEKELRMLEGKDEENLARVEALKSNESDSISDEVSTGNAAVLRPEIQVDAKIKNEEPVSTIKKTRRIRSR